MSCEKMKRDYSKIRDQRSELEAVVMKQDQNINQLRTINQNA